MIKNTFTLVWSLALLASTVQANISPLAFKGIFKHFKPGYELYAPNIGCAALKNGTVDAIRFYNVIPGAKDAQDRRLYIQDTALNGDPFAALAILLFPSPAGQLTAMTSHSQSIGAQLSVQDVATLLNFCAKVRATVSASRTSEKGEKIHFMGGNECGSDFNKVIKRLQSAAQNQIDIDYFKNFLSNHRRFSLILPRAKELLCVLCKCIELEERDDRRVLHTSNPEHYKSFEKYAQATFYSKYTPEMLLNAFFCLKFGSANIQELIQNLDDQIVDHQVMFEDDLLDENDLQSSAAKQAEDATLDDLWVIQNRDLVDSVIPYARQCVPVNNGLACGYDRAQNKLLENKTYPDCTETTIRHLCNLVLYNKQTKNWNFEHAHKQICDMQMLENLEDFYQIQKTEQANAGEMSVRNAWSKVLNNLDTNIRYNQKYLPNSPHNDNEVDSGLVNIMRVLNTVFNLRLEQEPVCENDQQYAQAVQNWVKRGLEIIFEKLSPEKQNVSINVSDAQHYIASDQRPDCSGKINVRVGDDFKFVMSVGSGHAQFDSITTLAPETIKVDSQKTDSIMQRNESRLMKSVGEQLFLLSAATKEKAQGPIHQLFSSTIVDSATIIIMLKKLCEMIQTNAISCTRAAPILQNALQRFLWHDAHMSGKIQPVLQNLFNLKNENILSVLKQEVKTVIAGEWLSDCFQDSIDDLVKFFINVEILNLSNSEIKKLQLFGDCSKLTQLDLSRTMNLEEIRLAGTFDKLKKIDLSESVIKKLELAVDCPRLMQLNLSSTYNLEEVRFAGTFDKLEKIDLSKSGIKKLELSADNCPQLVELCLSSTYNLEKVRFAGTFDKLEKIDLSVSGIKKLELTADTCPQLTQLKLSSTYHLEELGLISTFDKLEKIDLSESGIKKLELSADNCPQLVELCLSPTYNLEEVRFAGTFDKLKKIDLSSSGIKKLELTVDNCPQLTELKLSLTKKLEEVGLVGTFSKLEKIDLSASGIKKLELTADNCPQLKQLYLCFAYNLEEVRFAGTFDKLEKIDLCKSGIKKFELTADNCPGLTEFELSWTSNLEEVRITGTFSKLEKIDLSESGIKKLELTADNCPQLKKLDLYFAYNLEEVRFAGTFDKLKKIDLPESGIKELVLQKNSFPKLKSDDPRIKFVDKKRKRDDDDGQFEGEVGKESKILKLDEAEQAAERNNANDEIMDD